MTEESIFGVDKNPMAVELAKVALWLYPFYGRCAALVPRSPFEVRRFAARRDARDGARWHERARHAVPGGRTDAARRSAATSLEAAAECPPTPRSPRRTNRSASPTKLEGQVAPIHALLDFWRMLRWASPRLADQKKKKIGDKSPLSVAELAVAEIFSGRYNLSGVLVEGRIEGQGPDVRAANDLLARAVALAKRERFFHWWTAFPTVWRAGGGFDAVIGNPPWDRIKLQQVEWFAERELNIARQARAADRKRMIDDVRKKGAPLSHEYLEASQRAESQARVLRDSGDYPLLGAAT